jgi:hypothetical protein
MSTVDLLVLIGVILLKAILLRAILLSSILQNVILLNVILPSVVALSISVLPFYPQTRRVSGRDGAKPINYLQQLHFITLARESFLRGKDQYS